MAIILVVIFHATISHTIIFSHFQNGALLFFMVSGFIISYKHKNTNGIVGFKTYCLKRALRIYPPYIPLTIAFITAFYFTGKGSQYHSDPINIIRNLLLINTPLESIHPYAWTLVFEAFYYLSFGIVCVLAGQRVEIYCILLVLISVPYFIIENNNKEIFHSSYHCYFAIGALLGKYHNLTQKKINTEWKTNLLLGANFLIVATFISNEIYTFLSCCIFFFTYIHNRKTNIFLITIGTASYSIYLTHAIIMIPASKLPYFNGITPTIAVIASLILGHIYHKKIETPSIRYLSRKLLKY